MDPFLCWYEVVNPFFQGNMIVAFLNAHNHWPRNPIFRKFSNNTDIYTHRCLYKDVWQSSIFIVRNQKWFKCPLVEKFTEYIVELL